MASDDEQTTVVEHNNVLELSPALMGQVRFPPGCSILYQSPENDGSLTLMGTVVSPCIEVDGHTLRQTHKRVSVWYRVQFNIRSSSSSVSQDHRMIPEAHLQYARKCPVWVRPQQTQTQTQTQEWLEGTILASFQTESDDTSPSFSETESNVLALAAAAAVDTCYVVKLDGKEGRVGDITNNVTHDALRYRPPTTTTSVCPSTPQRKALITTSTTPTISAPTTPGRTSNQTLTPPRPLSTIPKESLPMPIAVPVTVTSTHTMNDKTPTKAAHRSDMETSIADDSTMSGSSGSIGVTNHHTDGGNVTTTMTSTTISPTPTTARTRIEYPPWIEPLKLFGHDNNSNNNNNNIRHSMRTMSPLTSPPSKRQKTDVPPFTQPSPGSFTYTSLLTTMDNAVDSTKPNMPPRDHYHDDKEPKPNMPPRDHYHDDKERDGSQFLTALSSPRHARDDHSSTSNSDTNESHSDKDRTTSFLRQAVSPRAEMERYNSPSRSINDSSRNHERMLFLPPWLNVAIITDWMIGHGGRIHKQLCAKYHCFIKFMKGTAHRVGALKVFNSDEYGIRQAMKGLVNIILDHLNGQEQTRFIYETARVGESIPSAAWHRTVWEHSDVPVLQRCPDEGMKLMWMGHARLSKEGNPGGYLIGKNAERKHKIQKETNCRLTIIGSESDLPGPYALLIGRDRETVTNAIKMVNAKVNKFLRFRNANPDGLL
eukprot:scaffold11223_cov57-Attheya_sp.AAC.6